MKHQLYILLISLMFAFPAWSDSHEENIDEDSGSVKVQIDINDSDDSENDEENFEKSIKTSVLSIVEHILEEVADDLDEEEKSEIEAAIKEIKSEIKDEQHGASVHIDDDVPLAGIALGGLAIIFIFWHTYHDRCCCPVLQLQEETVNA